MYSPFPAGAALLTTQGGIITGSKHTTGTNSYNMPPEIVALTLMNDIKDKDGNLLKLGSLLVIVTEGYHEHNGIILPDGASRQILCEASETSGVQTSIILMDVKKPGILMIASISDLLPFPHHSANLGAIKRY